MGDGGVVMESLPLPEPLKDVLSPSSHCTIMRRGGGDLELRQCTERNREFQRRDMPERNAHSRRNDIEEGEVLGGEFERPTFAKKWRRDEIEQGEFINRRWRRGNNGEFPSTGRYRWNKPIHKREFEWGEIAPEKRRKLEGDRVRSCEPRRSPEEQRKRLPSSIVKCENSGGSSRVSGSDDVEPGEIKSDNSNDSNKDWPRWSAADSDNKRRVEENSSSSRTIYPDRFPYKNARGGRSISRHPSSRPGNSDWGQHDRSHHHDYRDRSPVYNDRSPPHRFRQPIHRDRTPSHQRFRRHEHRERTPRERTPGHPDRSPHNRHSAVKPSRSIDKPESSKIEEKQKQKANSVRQSSRSDSNRSSEERAMKENPENGDTVARSESIESLPPPPSPPPPPPPPSSPPPPVMPPPPPLPPLANGNADSLQEDSAIAQVDMEEDMDICDTPPHASTTSDVIQTPVSTPVPGKWFYLDNFGMEQGPSTLADLKALVEEGYLQPDHMIKHENSDYWLTVENAASPVVTPVFPSVLGPTADPIDLNAETEVALEETPRVDTGLPDLNLDIGTADELEMIDEYSIDERIATFLEGYVFKEGAELDILSEALESNFTEADFEGWCRQEGSKLQPRLSEFSRHLRLNEETNAAGKWPCRGGDWKRDEERRKIVVNDGFPLCQMPPRGTQEDPRLFRSDVYQVSRTRNLTLPSWAFSSSEDTAEPTGDTSKGPAKPPRGTKGTLLTVTRINACVVKEKSNSSDSRIMTKVARGAVTDRQLSRSTRSHSIGSDRGLVYESVSGHHSHSGSKRHHEADFQSLHHSRTLAIPKDHVPTVDELSVDLGGWFYLDGTGQERGPYSYNELQSMVRRGYIVEHMSVFRKIDNTWLPAVKDLRPYEGAGSANVPSNSGSKSGSGLPSVIPDFNVKHPQFLAYMKGKLHELVMKSFKTRELASTINEVLDPWLTSKQPKKEIELHPFNSTITKNNSSLNHNLSENEAYRSAKRARLLQGGDDDSNIWGDEDPMVTQMKECSFEELRGGAQLTEDISTADVAGENWGSLDRSLLARVFHYLKADMRSIQSSASTCKSWYDAVVFYKGMCQLIDLSSAGTKCNDMIFRAIMGGYDLHNVTTLVLVGCTNISSGALEETLCHFSNISFVDIRGCIQLRDLQDKFHYIKWIYLNNSMDSYFKMKSLRQITDKRLDLAEAARFRPGFYKRSKFLLDSKKSSEVLSRDAQMKRWLQKKSEYEYRKKKDFVSNKLKEIMKGNRSDFFDPKVAQIEDKLRNGYYSRRGLSSLKDDISRMCRDAMKVKTRGDTGEMKQTIMAFIQLAKRLEDPKPSNGRDESGSLLVKDNSESKPKKKQVKGFTEKKGASKVDREIKRSLSKLKKRAMDSDSETSDDFSEDGPESDSSSSETESDSTVLSDPRGPYDNSSKLDDSVDYLADEREWGARMTKASLVPPVTRKYEVIDKYLIVTDEDEVKRKMTVALPEDYSEKVQLQKNGTDDLDMLELPEVKDYKPRKTLGDEVVEQEVYGIDPYTHNLLLDSMPEDLNWPLTDKQVFIEEMMLKILNKQVRNFTGSGNTPMVYPLQPVFEEMQTVAEAKGNARTVKMCMAILRAMRNRPDDNYVAYRKGLGVVCNKEEGIGVEDFVVEFLGEVYPAWRWYEKQDGIRSLQKNNQEPAPEFYNIYLERPKGDRDGYDLVVVDAMHKANYASRICHSCRPNCEAKVTAVDGQYQIGIYATRPISYGEEITFDYNSVTESKEEYEASVCLCGSQICRGSYLSLASEEAFQNTLQESHGILDRHKLLLEACEANQVSEQDLIDLGKAGLGTCLLSGLPDWLVAYSARLVRFINFERTKLPDEIFRRNLEEKRKYFSDISIENEKVDAEIQAEGVYNSRLQNLALTLDKVKYVMKKLYGDAKKTPPPLERLTGKEKVYALWKGEGSLVNDMLESMEPHMDPDSFSELKSKICALVPSESDDRDLRRCLLWLRDELRSLECSYKCRHDAAADLIHIYAYTKCLFKVREYKSVKSPAIYISPLDMGPKYTEKTGSMYTKAYDPSFILGQLIYWFSQTNADPDSRLARARKGCLTLPDISSFYTKSSKNVRERFYGARTVRFMLSRMEKQPQRPWPKEQIWEFKDHPKFFGSPMLDVVLDASSLDRELVNWLKTRQNVFYG